MDDNAELRQLVKQIVRKQSEIIFECEDGDEVLTAYDAHRPDWVVMDVEMKRMDGLTATAALLALYPQAKVVVVTKYTDANTREAAMKAGAVSFVGKDDLLGLRSILR